MPGSTIPGRSTRIEGQGPWRVDAGRRAGHGPVPCVLTGWPQMSIQNCRCRAKSQDYIHTRNTAVICRCRMRRRRSPFALLRPSRTRPHGQLGTARGTAGAGGTAGIAGLVVQIKNLWRCLPGEEDRTIERCVRFLHFQESTTWYTVVAAEWANICNQYYFDICIFCKKKVISFQFIWFVYHDPFFRPGSSIPN
jgi:hypothetical protein